MLTSIVPKGVSELAVSKYLTRAYPMLPGFCVRAALKKKDVRVNGKKVSEDVPVFAGDEVSVYTDKKYEPVPLCEIYRDECLVAFQKPAGLPVDADADGIGDDTVIARLKSAYGSAFLVHRLDTGTAGVMLAALNKETEEKLSDAFKNHKVRKHYRALAIGKMPKQRQSMKAYLTKKAGDAKVFVTDDFRGGAREIETEYTVLGERLEDGVWLSELDVAIYTGRTHQIRAHMAHIGHPLLGDDKYGDRQANKRLSAADICLQCAKMGIFGAEGLEKYEGMWFEAEEAAWKYGRKRV